MNKINALIIDDELMNRKLLSKLIPDANGHFNIVDTADNIVDAFDMITKHCPDVIFLDIKMPGGSGFDLLRRFENPQFEVVFVTGFDDYAIKAFEFNALDYVLKPIDSVKLTKTLETIYVRIISKLSITNNLKEILSVYNSEGLIISKIPLHDKNKVILVDLKDIVSIESDDGYTKFNVIQSETYISSKQFASFEFILDSHKNFIRISRSAYINIRYIRNYSKGICCVINLINGQSYEVSRRKKSEILFMLSKINSYDIQIT